MLVMTVGLNYACGECASARNSGVPDQGVTVVLLYCHSPDHVLAIILKS